MAFSKINVNSLTNFQKVQEFNRAFDMAPKEPKNYSSFYEDELGRIQWDPFKYIKANLFIESPKTIKLRLALISEEIEELNTACKEHNLIETRDAVADILYVVYGMADVLGIEINSLFNRYVNNLHNNLPNEKRMEMFENIGKYSNTEDSTRAYGVSNFDFIRALLDCDKTISNESAAQYLALINESYTVLETETLSDVATRDEKYFANLADKICTLLQNVYSMAYVLKIDADCDFAIVHNSNMSKLCDTEEDARATVADYEAKFAKGESPYDTPYYYYLEDIGKYIVKNRSTGKALKNIKYKKVNFNAE
jgi:predicted HAD superfamily Cof-like phosphohydrolase